jgi:hypothetical protein
MTQGVGHSFDGQLAKRAAISLESKGARVHSYCTVAQPLELTLDYSALIFHLHTPADLRMPLLTPSQGFPVPPKMVLKVKACPDKLLKTNEKKRVVAVRA